MALEEEEEKEEAKRQALAKEEEEKEQGNNPIDAEKRDGLKKLFNAEDGGEGN